MRNIQFKDIKEIPGKVMDSLYNKRFPDNKNISYDDYKKIYRYIIVDNIIYINKENEQRAAFCELSSTYGVRLADAVIKENKIIKNRYGYQD